MLTTRSLVAGMVFGLLLGLCGCIFPSGNASREDRDKLVRAFVKAIVDNDLESAAKHIRACTLPVTQDDITRDYGKQFLMPIHIAVRYGRIEILKMILEKQRQHNQDALHFDLDARDYAGDTAIIYAQFAPRATREELIRFLVANGADINARDANMRMTALHTGVLLTSLEYTKLLIELGANVNLQDKHGRTPMHIICGMEHGVTPEREAVFHALLKAKPNLTLKDRDGLTAEQIAEKLGYTDYVEKLRAASKGLQK